MEFARKESLAMVGEIGLAACAIRLRAAVNYVGKTQRQFAVEAGIKPTVLNNGLAGLTYPSRDAMVYLYRAHRIDFNFILHGDFAQLPGDVQDRLFPLLDTARSEWDQKENSGRGQDKPRTAQ